MKDVISKVGSLHLSNMKNKTKIIVSIGSNGNYFLRNNSKLIAGINEWDDMELFLECYKNKLLNLNVEFEVFFTGFNHYSEANK